jgi:hypothetical protein
MLRVAPVMDSNSLPTTSTSSSPSSSHGHGIIQYHHFPPPQHQHYQHLQEEDVQLHDYQMGHSHIGHHGGQTQIIGFEINPTQKDQQMPMEKRKRTNYSMGGNKAKIEEAVKYLLELSERARPNVRNVAEKVRLSISPSFFPFCNHFNRWEFLTIL